MSGERTSNPVPSARQIVLNGLPANHFIVRCNERLEGVGSFIIGKGHAPGAAG
jgi:hypothetical protein